MPRDLRWTDTATGNWHYQIPLAEEGNGAVKTWTRCKNKDQMAALSPDNGEPPKRRQPPGNHILKTQELRQQFKVQGCSPCRGFGARSPERRSRMPLSPAWASAYFIFHLSSLIIHHSPEGRTRQRVLTVAYLASPSPLPLRRFRQTKKSMPPFQSTTTSHESGYETTSVSRVGFHWNAV